jgi:hypothetical protein
MLTATNRGPTPCAFHSKGIRLAGSTLPFGRRPLRGCETNVFRMSFPQTMPVATSEPRWLLSWRTAILLLIVVACVRAALVTWRTPDPLVGQLIGGWSLKSNSPDDDSPRTMEFNDSGSFWIYPTGKRDVRSDPYRWRISNGELVVVFDDPLQSPGASFGRRAHELVRRVTDIDNVARSYRYSAQRMNSRSIRITLIQERGNPPKQLEWATLTRPEAESSP